MSLQKIQERLKAPKNQYNSFGKYKYRNLEDILEALKPILAEYKYNLIISDRIEEVGGRVYVRAHAQLRSEDTSTIGETFAYAREDETKKGMAESQITGATSSYARKYALNGLFCIDDTKDADGDKPDTKKPENTPKEKPLIIDLDSLQKEVDQCKTQIALQNLMKMKQSSIKKSENSDSATALFTKRKEFILYNINVITEEIQAKILKELEQCKTGKEAQAVRDKYTFNESDPRLSMVVDMFDFRITELGE